MSYKYKQILYYLSVFVMMIGVIQLIPLINLIFFPEELKWAYCFLIPGITAIVVGVLMNRYFQISHHARLENHYDKILVVSIWILAILVSTAPWLLSGHYNFSQAMFEVTSGFSTTGLTVVDVEACPKMFLVFRSVCLFVGGVGLVLIISCALSDRFGLNVYNADGHTDRILPNLARSARLILSIYTAYIIVGTIAYIIAGMSAFDAINTAIAALSTGGFSVRNESIYAYHSVPIEIITIVLMMLGGTNFVIHYSLFRRKFKVVFKHCETKFLIGLIVIFVPFMVYNLIYSGYETNLLEAIRITVFQFVSCITTTGFVSIPSLNFLPPAFATVMILMMLIGGNQESTAGGIKQYRVIVSMQGILHQIKDTISNPRIIKVKTIDRLGKKEVLSDDEIQNTTVYIFFYLLLFLIGSFIFTWFGYSLQDSMLEFSSALSTVGLSVGITGYNAHPIILWTGTVAMFFGRLEIMIIFEALLKVRKDIKTKNILTH